MAKRKLGVLNSGWDKAGTRGWWYPWWQRWSFTNLGASWLDIPFRLLAGHFDPPEYKFPALHVWTGWAIVYRIKASVSATPVVDHQSNLDLVNHMRNAHVYSYRLGITAYAHPMQTASFAKDQKHGTWTEPIALQIGRPSKYKAHRRFVKMMEQDHIIDKRYGYGYQSVFEK
jgi:hypothetical protein